MNSLSKIQDVYFFKDHSILRVDSLGVYENLSVQPEIVLLNDSPKINLDRLIHDLNPQLIIADGSNYKSYAQRWEHSCIKTNTPFINTYKQGAVQLTLFPEFNSEK